MQCLNTIERSRRFTVRIRFSSSSATRRSNSVDFDDAGLSREALHHCGCLFRDNRTFGHLGDHGLALVRDRAERGPIAIGEPGGTRRAAMR